VGFFNPHNLLWGASLALLVLIYLRSRSRPTIEVSSLLLFDEAPAPVARVRHVRIDLLFWLEVAALSALTLAAAGLYAKLPHAPGRGRTHALVFDLGAGMSARDGATTRLDEARRAALAIVRDAPADDEFAVVGYALDAEVRLPETANLDAVRRAIASLSALAVPARPAALAAALMRVRGSAQIEVFADRPLPAGALDDVEAAAKVNFHRVGSPADNLAIVALDPGTPGAAKGRVVLRNFATRPHLAELAVDLGQTEVAHQSVILAPREQLVVQFGPIRTGGLVRARILTGDAIAADNTRYAYAASDRPAHVLILSQDPSNRADLAQVLMAVNPSFIIETADPAKFVSGTAAPQFNLAVMDDCYVRGIAADATLLVYPPPSASAALADLRVTGTLTSSELRDESPGGVTLALGATRLFDVPEWMEVTRSAHAGERGPFPAAAFGRAPLGLVGVLAFSVRNHLLLDPDHLDALVTAVDLIKRLTAPSEFQIVSTGTYASVPASVPARVTAPDGSVRTLTPDASGRVRIRALESGRYTIDARGAATQLLANYYDASESDLVAEPSAAAKAPPPVNAAASRAPHPVEIQPLAIALMALVLAMFLVESAILARHAARWGMRHV
jgi:Aerotolerance regulator N-terminal/von Willebrand factor type A domain